MNDLVSPETEQAPAEQEVVTREQSFDLSEYDITVQADDLQNSRTKHFQVILRSKKFEDVSHGLTIGVDKSDRYALDIAERFVDILNAMGASRIPKLFLNEELTHGTVNYESDQGEADAKNSEPDAV